MSYIYIDTELIQFLSNLEEKLKTRFTVTSIWWAS